MHMRPACALDLTVIHYALHIHHSCFLISTVGTVRLDVTSNHDVHRHVAYEYAWHPFKYIVSTSEKGHCTR